MSRPEAAGPVHAGAVTLSCTYTTECRAVLRVTLSGSPVEDVAVQVGAVRVSLICGAALCRVQLRALDAARAIRAQARTPAAAQSSASARLPSGHCCACFVDM